MTALRFLAFVTNGMQLMPPPGAAVAQRDRSVGDSLRAVRSSLFLTPFAGGPLVVGGVNGENKASCHEEHTGLPPHPEEAVLHAAVSRDETKGRGLVVRYGASAPPHHEGEVGRMR